MGDSSGDGTITLDEFTRKVNAGGEIKDFSDTFEGEGFDLEEYKKVTDGVKHSEHLKHQQDVLIAQFTDILLNRGSGSDTLRRLDKAQKGFLTKDEFIEGISMSESSDDSDTLNIYYPKAHAEILADKFFREPQGARLCRFHADCGEPECCSGDEPRRLARRGPRVATGGLERQRRRLLACGEPCATSRCGMWL